MGMSHTKWDHSIYIVVISMEKGIHFNENKQKKMTPKKKLTNFYDLLNLDVP